MKMKHLSVLTLCTFFIMVIVFSCTKNTNPQPPVHDTVTVKTTDTLYAAKPDTTVNLTRGLLLYLPFSGSIADSSGNGNPTTAMNGAGLTYDTHGYANNAFGSDGTDQVILVTNNGSIKFDTAYSLSVDFMTNDLSNRQVFVSMVDYDNGNGPSFLLGTSVPYMTNVLSFGANDITEGCGNDGGLNPNKVSDTTSFVPQIGAWYNLILIYHRGATQLYINGSLNSAKTGTGTLASLCSASQIVIGGWWSGDPIAINGKLDNVRLYNRVLTPHEIAALASNYQVTSTSVRPGARTGQAH